MSSDPFPNDDLVQNADFGRIKEEDASQMMTRERFGDGIASQMILWEGFGEGSLLNYDLGSIWEGIPSQMMIGEGFRKGLLPE